MKHLGPRREPKSHMLRQSLQPTQLPQLAALQESLERREELLTQQEQLAAARWIPFSTFSLNII